MENWGRSAVSVWRKCLFGWRMRREREEKKGAGASPGWRILDDAEELSNGTEFLPNKLAGTFLCAVTIVFTLLFAPS